MPVSGSPASGVVVRIYPAAMQAFLTQPGHPTARFLLTKMLMVRNSAILYCPVRTGRLRASIQTDGPHGIGTTRMYGTVGTNVEYAWWVHEGRGPVRPVNARVLHWVSPSGEDVFRPYAGPAEGQPFLAKAMTEHGIR